MCREARKSFDSLMVLTVWIIWLEPDARTFTRASKTANQLVAQIGEEASLWAQAHFTSMTSVALAFGLPGGPE
jgi:hypothetical protein